MIKKLLVPLLSVPIILSACSSNEGSPVEGQYQQTVKITELDFPEITDEAKAQTITQMEIAAGGETGGLFCMKGGDGGAHWKQAARQMSNMLEGSCETKKDEGNATSIDLEMACTGTAKGDMTVTMKGQANEQGYDSQMVFDIKDPGSSDTAKLAMNIGAKRVGDCPG